MRRDECGRASVVIPACAAPSTVACLRSLGEADVHTIVVSEKETAPAFVSAYCDEAIAAPSPNEDLDGYADALLGLARRDDVRTIVPVREEDAFVLATHRASFADHVATPWPDRETLERVHDRIKLAQAAEAAGVPHPRTRRLSEVDEWSEPAVVKSRYNLCVPTYVDEQPSGTASRNKSIQYLEPGEVPDREALHEAYGHEPIVQEFVPFDDEYMVGTLYDEGAALASVHHHQIRGTSYANGGGVYRRSIVDPALDAVAERLLDHLEWHGLACIEYMQDPETGAYHLTEINPRMWMSLSANVRMGADIPRYYWLAATDRAAQIEPGYEQDVHCQYLKGELCYLASLFTEDSPFVEPPSLPAALYDVATATFAHRTFDVLDRDDPWPFVADLVHLLDARLPSALPLTPWLGRLAGAEAPRDWQQAARVDVEGPSERPMGLSATEAA